MPWLRLLVVSCALFWGPVGSAFAAPQAEEEEDEEGAKKEALPADPSGKLYEKFQVQRGFFLSTEIGLVWTFADPERGFSNTQPYVGLNIGYDFNSWFSWQIHGGRGFNANAPRTEAQWNRIRDFAWTAVETGPVVWLKVWERLAIELKALGGIAILDPVPVEPDLEPDGRRVNLINPAVGFGIGLKYFTLLTNFTLGFEATGHFLIGLNMPSLNVSPLIIRYTF